MTNAAPNSAPNTETSLTLKNHVTPRIFIAATRMDDGKTTTSIGLFAALKKRFNDIGYIKPVGQRFVQVEGLKIDEDTMLVNETYKVRTPLRAMSPIAVEPNFTRRYLSGGNHAELARKVQTAFDESAWEKNFIIIEGTGHAGVGSVFDLSNATVAKMLHSKVIIVSSGGIGKPIDEIALNLALFEKHGVEVVGAILNKVMPDKMDLIREYGSRGLQRLGLPLLGVMPYNTELRKPTLNQVHEEIRGTFITGAEHKRRRVTRVQVGAMAARNAEHYVEPGTLIITGGDRDELIVAILRHSDKRSHPIAGVVLTDGVTPPDNVMDMIRQRNIPFIQTSYDVYSVASAITRMTVKTEIGDRDKIGMIENLISQNVDVDRIISLVTQTDPSGHQMALF
jgi:BioD-like phosphotransacetylase family protein